MRRHARRIVTIVLVGAVALLIVQATMVLGLRAVKSSEHRRLSRGAAVGWSRQMVTDRLGAPDEVLRSLGELRPLANGWTPTPTRPVDHELLVYNGTFYRLYVYLSRSDRVAWVQFAKT